MKLRLFQIDAFADRLFEGNPAAVVPLESWLPDALLQSIASENNLSETAFSVPSGSEFHLRWFTPVCEVDLCGHATLASAHVLFRHLGHPENSLVFYTRSGNLVVEEKNRVLVMDFPAIHSNVFPSPEEFVKGLGKIPVEVLTGKTCIAVFQSAEDILSLSHPMTRSYVLWIFRGSRSRLRVERPRRVRFLQPLLRSEGRGFRGPGVRFRPLCLGSLLGREAGKKRDEGPGIVETGGDSVLYGQG